MGCFVAHRNLGRLLLAKLASRPANQALAGLLVSKAQ
ncbi:hypothetical protein COLO4_15669 [Corchorus olitorius]|uniref:Uncharacterized protein n=1 Tax=Corchorus olitorius TaxID=93759 RepID=A0A1R3JM57_9ROSI|nr:hypothetical protein COLO4_15669 [Corchorus olitorius]